METRQLAKLFQRMKLLTGKKVATVAEDNGVSRSHVNMLYAGPRINDERLAQYMLVSLDQVIAEQEHKLKVLKGLRKRISLFAPKENGE